MNLLVWGISNENRGRFSKLLNRIKINYNIEKTVILYVGNRGDVEPISETGYSYYNLEISSIPSRGCPDYSRCRFFGECLPVDAELLSQMAPYEGEFMKMLDRRNLRSYEERWRIYIEHLRYWNTALDRWKIDCYVHEIIPHMEADYVVYALCQIKKIKFVGMVYGFFLSRAFVVTDIYNQFERLKKEVSEIQDATNGRDIELSELAKKYFEEYVSHMERKRPPDVQGAVSKSNSYRGLLKRRFLYIKSYLRHFFSTDIECFACHRRLTNGEDFQEYYVLKKYYEQHTQHVDLSEDYIYVPLNVQPELSTSPGGGRYADLILYVEMLSYYLPKGWWLYVKEHPAMYPYERYITNSRSDMFYDCLLKLKNVKLVPLQEDTFDLIDNSKAVSVVAGSAGMEGYLRKKPVLLFGQMVLEAAPKVYVIRNNEDCRRAMDRIAGGVDAITDRDIKIFLKAMIENSRSVYGSMEPLFRAPEQSVEDSDDKLADGFFNVIKELFPYERV